MGEDSRIEIMTPLAKAFERGFANASASFAFLKKDTVTFKLLHSACHNTGDRFDFNDITSNSVFATMLTTEIFGNIFGKSYLLLTQPDLKFLTDNIEELADEHRDLKEEFIKEVDNILSASVITELSNELRIKIYGDIPMLTIATETPIEQIIALDFPRSTGNVFITAARFSFLRDPSVRPLFIWAIETEFLLNYLTAGRSQATLP